MKITKEQKLKMVQEHLEEGIPLSEIVKKYNYNISNVKYQCALYQRYGAEAFKDRGIQTYTREEKEISETMNSLKFLLPVKAQMDAYEQIKC